mgnify:CR=1 FL=1
MRNAISIQKQLNELMEKSDLIGITSRAVHLSHRPKWVEAYKTVKDKDGTLTHSTEHRGVCLIWESNASPPQVEMDLSQEEIDEVGDPDAQTTTTNEVALGTPS